ncbi:unnamed protein product, partial [Mesorhabditis belari]|uniref:Mediator of RNA polymerase II transcription subunit 10 n=1 Tax=Mesorhabditis belari TaxID=2138241 RepID=A0AAF3J3L4_9BILA
MQNQESKSVNNLREYITSIMTNGGPAPAEMDRYQTLERTLEQFQENARQMGIVASDFLPRNQENFNHKIHTLITGLQELDRARNNFDDIRIPLELLEFLDQGKNPQLYNKECLERVLNKNRQVNGKIELYKRFRSLLLKELGEEMPEEVAQYRYHRGENEKQS